MAADALLEGLRLKTVRFLLLAGAAALSVVAGRGYLLGKGIPWADLATVAALLACTVALSRHPHLRRRLTRLAFLLLYADVLDGLVPSAAWPVTSTHTLLPLLILAGTLLGDHLMTAASLLLTLSVYGWTAWRHAPLDTRELVQLTDLAILSVVAAAMSFAVWSYYGVLLRKVREQADALRGEMEEKSRLHAVLFHDIANPLTALSGTVEVARRNGATGDAMEQVERLGRRMLGIIESVRTLHAAPTPEEVGRVPVPLGAVEETLRDTFAAPLEKKGQRLEFPDGRDLAVLSDPVVLASSVLGNLLSNAVKFSPPGGTIVLSAEGAGGSVRISVENAGGPVPEEVLRAVREGGSYRSSPGTEGEEGSGYGLRIASTCTRRLGGTLEAENLRGRVRFTVTLPRAPG